MKFSEKDNSRIAAVLESDTQLLDLLMNHLPHSIFFKDINSQFTRINRACAVKFGLINIEEAIGKTDFDFFDDSHAQVTLDDEQRIIETGTPIIDKVEKETFPDKKKRVSWSSTTKMPLFDKDKNVIGTFGISRDITEQKIAELALRESEEKYRNIFENIQDVIYRTDNDGIVTDISPSIERYSGYDRKNIIGSPVEDFYYYQEDREKLIENLKVYGQVSDFEVRLKTADERLVYTSINANLLRDSDGNVEGVEGIMRDITDRKLAEVELKETYNFFGQILSTTSEGIYVLDSGLTYTYWNRQMEKLTGLKKKDVIGKKPREIFPHMENNELFANYDQALKGDRVVSDDYFFEITKTRKRGWVQAQYAPMLDEDKKINGVLVTVIDISKRKLAEEKLQKSDDTLNKLSEQVPGTIYQFQQFPDGSSCFPYSSNGIFDIYELSPEDIRTDAAAAIDRIYHEDLDRVKSSINRSYHTLQNWELDFRVDLPSKGILWIRGRAHPEKQPDDSVIWHGYLSDITERKQKENELNETLHIVSDQNSRLLNFAHIVSHNLRNHAGSISALLSLHEIEESEQEKEELLTYLNTASDRLNETIKDLNKLIDSQAVGGKDLKQIEFSHYLKNVKEILTTEIKLNSVQFEESIPDGLEIEYNPVYLESILLNLISNAVKYRHPERKPVIKINVTDNDDGVVLTVSDNGLGIDLKKYGEKLFGMYNTFHENKNSKGIGLYITKNQVESLGGKIDVESEPGKGTAFHVTLKTP
jgi:PAS domain S-box-containing protein